MKEREFSLREKKDLVNLFCEKGGKGTQDNPYRPKDKKNTNFFLATMLLVARMAKTQVWFQIDGRDKYEIYDLPNEKAAGHLYVSRKHGTQLTEIEAKQYDLIVRFFHKYGFHGGIFYFN